MDIAGCQLPGPVPVPNTDWKVPSIWLENEDGKPPIDLCSLFKCSDASVARCCQEKLILPPSKFPPKVSARDLVRDTIIHEAMVQADTYLIKEKTCQQHSTEIHYYLCCQKAKQAYDVNRVVGQVSKVPLNTISSAALTDHFMHTTERSNNYVSH